MYQDYELEPSMWHEKPLSFSWDTETGAVRGRDAARVLKMAAQALKEGELVGHPYPTVYKIRDPLRTPK